MPGQHSITIALDLVRMPVLARSRKLLPLPADVLDLIKIAAASPDACREATAITGEPDLVLVEAARFYLVRALFRPEADCYRILGLRPGASRTVARDHMRWLMEWLHPDRNGSWESVYAERVIKAWREFPSNPMNLAPSKSDREDRRWQRSGAVRVPWIRQPLPPISQPQKKSRAFAAFAVGLLLTFALIMVLGIADIAFDTNTVASIGESQQPRDKFEASSVTRSTDKK